MDKRPKAKAGACYFCGEETTDDYYCYGCHQNVCERCDELAPWGANHNDPNDHRVRRTNVCYGVDEG